MTPEDHWIQQAADWLLGNSSSSQLQPPTAALRNASESELDVLVDMILSQVHNVTETSKVRYLLQELASRLISESADGDLLSESIVAPDSLSELYGQLIDTDAIAAAHALQCLAAQPNSESLDLLVAALVDRPPEQWQHVGIAVSPLWRSGQQALEYVFQQLADSPVQPSTLAVLLDLGSHALRSGRVAQHPWQARHGELARLLRQMVVRLEHMQVDPAQFGESVQQVQQVLGDSVALTVSLCDTLGQIGGDDSTAALSEAMELAHRRIQAEAAAALARQGKEEGIARLVALAADPVTRCRVVKYAEELDISGAIDEQYRYPQALAESELVAWLSAPEQFGLPPTSIQHVETRTLYWPGYEEPRDTYLFRFIYDLPQFQVTNIGIAGPLTHAFSVDLTQLSLDDQFAIFAGWHAEHEEIFEVPGSLLNASQREQADRFAAAFTKQDYYVDSRISLTLLLGEPALLAKLHRDELDCYGVADSEQIVAFPVHGRPDDLTPDLVLAIYRGRKLLSAFN